MPITVRIDRRAGLRTTTMTGVVTDAELVDAAAAVVGDPDLDPAQRALINLTGIGGLEVTPAGLREVADLLAGALEGSPARPRVAVLAAAPRALSLVRIYERFAERVRVPYDYQVFESEAEARAWLGVE